MAQLNDLFQEVIDFSNTIAGNENPADPDFQHACRLFSDYLATQLKQIRRNMIGTPSDQHSRWTASELSQLNELIKRPDFTTRSCTDWVRELFQYCITLQHGKQEAA